MSESSAPVGHKLRQSQETWQSPGQFLHLVWGVSNIPIYLSWLSVQFSSVQSCPTLCDPMNHRTPGLPVHYRSLPKPMPIKSVMPSSHLSLCCPPLFLPPIPPSIRVFSNESTLHIRWPKYWSFSFSISPSNEHPGLISFQDALVVSPCSPRDSQESSPTPQFNSYQLVLTKTSWA